MKEKLEPFFVPPGVDGRKAYYSAKTLGYKYVIALQHNQEGKDSAWFVPDETDLIKTCQMINETGFYYKIHLINMKSDLPEYFAN